MNWPRSVDLSTPEQKQVMIGKNQRQDQTNETCTRRLTMMESITYRTTAKRKGAQVGPAARFCNGSTDMESRIYTRQTIGRRAALTCSRALKRWRQHL